MRILSGWNHHDCPICRFGHQIPLYQRIASWSKPDVHLIQKLSTAKRKLRILFFVTRTRFPGEENEQKIFEAIVVAPCFEQAIRQASGIFDPELYAAGVRLIAQYELEEGDHPKPELFYDGLLPQIMEFEPEKGTVTVILPDFFQTQLWPAMRTLIRGKLEVRKDANGMPVAALVLPLKQVVQRLHPKVDGLILLQIKDINGQPVLLAHKDLYGSVGHLHIYPEHAQLLAPVLEVIKTESQIGLTETLNQQLEDLTGFDLGTAFVPMRPSSHAIN